MGAIEAVDAPTWITPLQQENEGSRSGVSLQRLFFENSQAHKFVGSRILASLSSSTTCYFSFVLRLYEQTVWLV